MENKNKKDMSVDDLVKQLKLVLDIEDEKEDADERELSVSDAPEIEETAPEEEPKDAESAGSITEKVRLLDKYFEQEENKKSKKKNRQRDKSEKKKKKAKQPDDDYRLSFESNDEPARTEFTEDELTSFADEIGDMFSDPEESAKDEKQLDVTRPFTDHAAAVKAPVDEKPAEEEKPVAEEIKPVEEPAPAVEDIKPDADETIHAVEEAAAAANDAEEEKTDEPEFISSVITSETADDADIPEPANDTSDDISPFIINALNRKKPESEKEGKTKHFGFSKDDVEKTILKEEPAAPVPEGSDSDIEAFNVLFEDMHPDKDDAYTTSEEAIMDAFGERQEKPEKNPVSSYSDFSISRLESEAADEDDDGEGEKAAAAGYDEFLGYDQRKTFLDSFKKRYNSLRTSIILSSIFAILVFVYECLSFAGGSFPHFCSPTENPAVFILIDLQLFAFCAMFAIKFIIDGVKGVFTGKANIMSLGALSVLITFVYGILTAVTSHSVPHPVMSASALSIVLMLCAESRCVKRDTLNFRIISGTPAKPKFVFEAYKPRKNSAEDKEFYDYVPENPTMLRISKTEFVKGFFASNMKTSASKGYINLMFPVTALIFAIVLAVVLILKKDMGEAVNAAYTAFALCMPAAVFAAVTLPSFAAAKKTYADDSCVVSEAAAEEYADASVVTFEDSDVFPPSLDKITSVRLYNDSRMDYIMYVLTSLFRKIGGPLLSICENAAKEFNEYSNSVVIENAVENGIEATVDAQKVFLGSSVYMGSKLDPKYCTDDKQYKNDEKCRIMYMVINDVVTAKFYIEYEMDKDFLSVIKQLSTSTRCVAIRTLDPNIDTKLIKSCLDTEIYHCKIMRTRESERRKTVSKKSRGAVVARNSVKALLRSLMMCDRMVYSAKINMIICFLSVIIGLIFSVFMIITKTFDSITALHVLAYQILLAIVIRIVTKINI